MLLRDSHYSPGECYINLICKHNMFLWPAGISNSELVNHRIHNINYVLNHVEYNIWYNNRTFFVKRYILEGKI